MILTSVGGKLKHRNAFMNEQVRETWWASLEGCVDPTALWSWRRHSWRRWPRARSGARSPVLRILPGEISISLPTPARYMEALSTWWRELCLPVLYLCNLKFAVRCSLVWDYGNYPISISCSVSMHILLLLQLLLSCLIYTYRTWALTSQGQYRCSKFSRIYL